MATIPFAFAPLGVSGSRVVGLYIDEDGVLRGTLYSPREALSIDPTMDGSHVTDSSYMFIDNQNVTSWSIDLPNATTATSMFSGSGLTEFAVDMPDGLTEADGMFSDCELDETSAVRILTTLPTYTEGSHNISIGKNSYWWFSQDVIEMLGDTEAGDKTYKGWTVTVEQGDPKDPIQIRINKLMAETLEGVGQPGYNPSTNIAKWRALGEDAYEYDAEKYDFAADTNWSTTSFQAGSVVDDCLISMGDFAYGQKIPVASGVTSIVWNADLPSVSSCGNGGSISPSSVASLEWNGRMPNLTNGAQMFRKCTGLTEWSVDLPSLTNGQRMFQECTGLTSWNVDLPNLTNASYMFYDCTGLSSWTAELPAGLTDASYMFGLCSNLTQWTVDLPDTLSNTTYMFYSTGLTSWNVDLPTGLKIASQMFMNCTRLTSWSVQLPEGLQNAKQMFQGCTALTSYNGGIPSTLTNAQTMFFGCKALTSFDYTLPNSITDTTAMFSGCTALSTFSSGLPNKVNTCPDMFKDCSLDETSVLLILRSLPTKSSGTHEINIGKRTKWASSTDIRSLLGSTTAGTKTFRGWSVTVQS